MSKKYFVVITTTFNKLVHVEADSEEEAIKLAEDYDGTDTDNFETTYTAEEVKK